MTVDRSNKVDRNCDGAKLVMLVTIFDAIVLFLRKDRG